jgi:hypothetical protein
MGVTYIPLPMFNMKQPFFSVVLATSALAVFSFACLGASLPPLTEGKKEESPKNEAVKPVVVSAETLAQAVQDDVRAAAKKYHLTELQIDGVVSKHMQIKGEVHMIQFDVMVKDREKDKRQGFTIFFSLKDRVPKGDKRLEEFAVGKKVTVRGKSFAMGNGQVTLMNCFVVREADKGGAKGSKKP